MTETTIQKKVQALGLQITAFSPANQVEDACIELGGEHDGIHISIGCGYYSVVKETPEGSFIFVDGAGDLEGELKTALEAE